MPRVAACRQVLHSGTIALCSGIGFQKRHTFQWNAGFSQRSDGWCEFRNLCTGIRSNHSGMYTNQEPLRCVPEGILGCQLQWNPRLGWYSTELVCVLETSRCIPEWLSEHICIQWNQVGFGFHCMGVRSARLHCMCSACSAIHQHPICVLKAEPSAALTGSCKYNRTAELSGPKRQSERPRDNSAESLKDAAQGR